MTSKFILRCACRGKRPPAVQGDTGFKRQALVARLLKERGVARFIVAPDGYGKTSLALDYSETVLEWLHCFWVNAQSPCFIRDLDAGNLADEFLGADEEASLVVIEDLPLLDAERGEEFSHQIDVLLSRGCEVLVTCVPSCDASGALQHDCIRLTSRDLLASDKELELTRVSRRRDLSTAEQVPEVLRVPILVWGQEAGSMQRFAQMSLHEDLPGDLRLAMLGMMALRKGTIEELRLTVPVDGESLGFLYEYYPHLGISEELDAFECLDFAMDYLARAVRGRFDALASHSVSGDRAGLIASWIGHLLGNHAYDRACDVETCFDSRRNRCRWLQDNVTQLVSQCCIYRSFSIARDRKGISGELGFRMRLLEALCLRILGNEEGAKRLAGRIADDAEAPGSVRIYGALMMIRLGTSGEYVSAMRYLTEVTAALPAKPDAHEEPWELLARACCAAESGLGSLISMWESLEAVGTDPLVLSVCASWIYREIADELRRIEDSEEEREVDGEGFHVISPVKVEAYVRLRLKEAQEGLPDYFAASAGLSMEEAHRFGMVYAAGPLQSEILFGLRQVEMSLLSQRGVYSREMRRIKEQRVEWAAAHPEMSVMQVFDRPLELDRRIPVLSLQMFGNLRAAIGDDFLDQKLLSRQNLRALLVLLAVNQGKEISRERLIEAMWPDSDYTAARKNFYSVWSNLRKCLALPDGSCPYLVRHQYGCSLEQRYVRSDIARFGEICRELMFSSLDEEQCARLFNEIDRDFRCELLPCEQRNPLIIRARNEFRSRLVDALVAATCNTVDAGNAQWGIWFARAAIQHDEVREDAYAALMEAQIACRQRTAAMMTFLKCRSVLGERLGIDPSPRIQALYEGLLDS